MSRAFEPGRLSPLGTARQRLADVGAARGARDSYPVELLPELRDADLGPEWLFLAWEMATLNRGLSPAEQRELTAIFARALIDVAGGSTRTPVGAAARALLARATEAVGAPDDRRPFILDGGFLYQQRLLACEDRLAVALRARRAGAALATPDAVDQALAVVAASTQPALTDEQLAAVRAALLGRLTVISGGPGTGKTTIVLAIVRALAHLGVPARAVGLAAPTGKAANRLEQAIQHGLARQAATADAAGSAGAADAARDGAAPAAETLHRLLGWSPRLGGFAHHHNNRLAHRAIIVDESSMIDLVLMERLVRAVADDARLVLLGDADQLPSIEAGAVFRDLTPLAYRLTRSHRVDPSAAAGRQLADFARSVRDGAPDALAPTAVADVADIAFRGVEAVLPDGREGLLERWYQHALAPDAARAAAARHAYRARTDGQLDASDQERLAALHGDLQRARVLCVTRARPTGTAAVNAWLHRRHARGADGAPGVTAAFVPGEPVMVTRNDYQRGLYNGDQGVVVLFDEDDGRPPRLAAAFPTRAGWQAFPIDGIGDGLELSFAMTVHKAQGSELDTALLLLPDAAIPLMTRELLYTAVTRVRHGVVICGAPAVLVAGAAAALGRSSGLADKLG